MKTIKLTILFVILTLISLHAQTGEQQRPNIILILSDDVGFEELSTYKVLKDNKNTPNIDRMAREGVAFKTAWTQAIGGPSRALLKTGRYAPYNGAYDNKLFIPPHSRDEMMQLPTFMKILHNNGYKVGVAGKWHFPGGGSLGIHNDLLGVDEYIVYNSSPATYAKIAGIPEPQPDKDWEIATKSKIPILARYWKPMYIKNGKPLPTTINDYGPNILTNFICDFIEKNAKNDQPFLAFYPMVLAHSVHCVTPIEMANGATPSNKHYAKGTEEGRKVFKNQIKYLDLMVGKIMKKVEDAGIADNTIIIFASDNGTTASSKGRGVEYGVHVPFVVTGTGIKQRGLSDNLMDFSDVLPTLVDFAGAKLPEGKTFDGISLKPFLTGESDKTKDVIYSFPGISRLVRTKDYMLEAVCPLYNHPRGRILKVNGSYDGRGYENLTGYEEHNEIHEEFLALLKKYDYTVPEKFSNPFWQTKKQKKAFLHFQNPQIKKNHLSLPREYKFYDERF